MSSETKAKPTVSSEEAGNKKPRDRVRKKTLYKKIAQQMEFYFSDANLSQDRFLKKEYDAVDGGFINLDTFLRFNKIKMLGVTAEDLSKAIKRFSSQLTVDENCTQVKRLTKYKLPEKVDERTVYIEGLPKNADHDWVTETMSVYDHVNYVSLPRYPSTKQLKGFAFIEFASEEGAKKCLEAIGTKEFSKVNPFPKAGSKDIQRMQKAVVKKSDTEEAQIAQSKKKSKRSTSVSDSSNEQAGISEENSDEPAAKVSKHDKTSLSSTLESKSVKKRKRKASLSKLEESVETETNSKSKPVSKKPKTSDESLPPLDKPTVKACDEKFTSSKKEKKIPAVAQDKASNGSNKAKQNPETATLKALSKSDWSMLKKKYQETQKANMSALKQQLKKQKETVNAPQPDASQLDGFKSLEMIPGVVVEIKGDSELVRSKITAAIPEGVDVCYIDVKVGYNSGYIRCKSANDAKILLKLTCGDDYSLSLLQGEMESEYWKKLNQQRMETRDKSKKTKRSTNKRGNKKVIERHNKLVSKANVQKHIVFDDNDD